MDKSPRFKSLSAQLFAAVLAALALAIFVFVFCMLGANLLLDKTVYGQPFAQNLTDRRSGELQRYITAYGVTPQNLHPLDIWCSKGDTVYLSVYQDGRKLYESPLGTTTFPAEEEPAAEEPASEYTLCFADGSSAQAFLYCFAGDAYYYASIVLASLAAFFVFSVCFIIFVRRKLRDILLLKTELEVLAGGDLTQPITLRGQDELTELARGIDQMRKSVLNHQLAEEKARMANAELVTAMSHDLRTPLTSLLAYLELLDRGKYRDEAEQRHFIHRGLEKTMQIKTMADQLFEYFFVFSGEPEQLETETVDADALFGQMLDEYAFSLESKGYCVTTAFHELGASVTVNVALLRRVFDNLYSNLLKYAAPTEAIHINYFREENKLCFVFENGITPQANKKESTNIGLKTCARILQSHGGTFSAIEQSERFCTTMTLPLSS